MKKIHIKNTTLHLSEENKPDCGSFIAFKELLKHPLKEFIQKITDDDKEKKIIIADENEDKVLEYFANSLTHITACGGLVQNSEDEVLLIYRNEKWDLPKGKPDTGEAKEETAIREVREECGLMELEIIGKLPDTYHIYADEKADFVFKQCVWYHMSTKGIPEIIVQTEEGITDANWIALPVPTTILKNAFPSVRELVNYFQFHYLRSLRS